MWLVVVLPCSLLLATLTTCRAAKLPDRRVSDEAPLKMHIVDEIVKKICNISLSTFANKTDVEKVDLIKKVEDKLNKTALALGLQGAKYVKLIMEGIKVQAFGPNHSVERRTVKKVLSNNRSSIATQQHLRIKAGKESRRKMVRQTKRKSIDIIASKVQILVKKYMRQARTPEERKKAIQKVRRMLLESARRTHSVPDNKQEELNKYVDIITKGIEMTMNKNNIRPRRRYMNFDFAHKNDTKNESQLHVTDKKRNRVLSNDSILVNKPMSLLSTTNEYCDNKFTCKQIKLAKTLKCSKDQKEFNILELCDSKADCVDSSDEKECTKHAIETIDNTERLLKNIDASTSQSCFSDLANKDLISKQNKAMSDVLKQQRTVLEVQALEASAANYSRRLFNYKMSSTKETVHEAMNVVDSLTSALATYICSNFEGHPRWRSHADFAAEEQHYENLNAALKPAPEVCKCNGSRCANSCTQRCGHFCFEMFSMSQLTCQAVSGDEYVSLDHICDGKVDCYDESDERDCSVDSNFAKFEATNMYNYILKDIERKVRTVNQKMVRRKLQNLYALVLKYQRLSLNQYSDASTVKLLRKELFDELMAVYESAMQKFWKKEDLFDIQFYLVALKERLISAIKRSNTGNVKMESLNRCACSDFKCALPQCSKSCKRKCLVEPKLTRFVCEGPVNITVPIELLCDGNPNCPNGEDETKCQKGLCRSLQLKMLAQKLQQCGKHQRGTVLGEAFRQWKLKAKAILVTAEEGERPSLSVLREILHGILHDLVDAYPAPTENKELTILQEFSSCSRIIIDTLKTCNY